MSPVNQNPKIETLQKIADALDIPVNRLLAGKIISRDELKEKLSEYGLTHLVPDTEEERTVLENCKKLNETGKKEAAKKSRRTYPFRKVYKITTVP